MTKSYSSKSAATAAIKKQGLQWFPHVIRWSSEGHLPVFFPMTADDRSELVQRGWCVDKEENAPWYPQVGKTYQHYKKGDLYRVTAIGPETESMRLMVTYEPLYECEFDTFNRFMHGEEDGVMYGWMDPLPRGGIRFNPVEE